MYTFHIHTREIKILDILSYIILPTLSSARHSLRGRRSKGKGKGILGRETTSAHALSRAQFTFFKNACQAGHARPKNDFVRGRCVRASSSGRFIGLSINSGKTLEIARREDNF